MVLAGVAALPAAASAHRRPTRAERRQITGVLGNPNCVVVIKSIEISTAGPYVLVHDTYCGQETWDTLKRLRRRRLDKPPISGQGLRCWVPTSVVRDLRLERYNGGPHPCARYGRAAG